MPCQRLAIRHVEVVSTAQGSKREAVLEVRIVVAAIGRKAAVTEVERNSRRLGDGRYGNRKRNDKWSCLEESEHTECSRE
jgi:hypothetical protein